MSVFSTQMNKTSNIITHIKLMHKDYITAYQHIPDAVKSRIEKEWDFRLSNPDAPVKSTAQPSELAPIKVQQQTSLAQFQSLPVAKQKTIWMKAIVLGGLPYNLKGNLGLNYAISQYNGGVFPRGLSRSTLTNDISLLYETKLMEKKRLISGTITSLKSMKHAGTITTRLFAIQHDGWSSMSSTGYLGIILNFIHVCKKRGWMLSKLTLGCIPFDASHTAKATLDLARDVLNKFGLMHQRLSTLSLQSTKYLNYHAFVIQHNCLSCILLRMSRGLKRLSTLFRPFA